LAVVLSLSISNDGAATFTVITLIIHHIAYTCNLFARTGYDPSNEAVEALTEYHIHQLSHMFADPVNRISLSTRQHCAAMNHRGLVDFILLRAKKILAGNKRGELLNFNMHRWLYWFVEEFLNANAMAKFFRSHNLHAVIDINVESRANYTPAV
jgi:hypothetical protein